MSLLDLIATSTFGLEAVVTRELRALGYSPSTLQPGRILFRAEPSALARANLWLRASDRVLVMIGRFPARDFGELFDQTHALPWDEWMGPDAAFPVKGRSVKSQLSSVPACQKIVKKAIVEKLRVAHGVSELPEVGPVYGVEVSLLEDTVTLTLDTTGAGLHKRGYRKLSSPTPLKETLAAGLVLLSFWRPERPFLDPFCGSGTLPIEAALIGKNRAPGLGRRFAAESWPQIPASLWAQAREEARDLVRALPRLTILGTDRDAEVLRLALTHARDAGVAEDVRFEERNFVDLSSADEFGCLITNPPYGDRTEDRAEVERLYRLMPEVLRRLPTWSHYILTSHRDFEVMVGQTADRRRKLYNGPIECTYYQFQGPRPDARAPAPAFGGLSEKARAQAELFRRRLTKRARHLRKWPGHGITCYRLYERDIKEVPLVVDRYGDFLHVVEIDFRGGRSPAEEADWLDLMAETAGEVLGVPRSHVFVKRKRRQRGRTQHERVSTEGRVVEVEEGGLRFLVNLSDYVDTGLFLDHRKTRAMVRELARGKRFLNLFAYTGSFSVYAAAGEARSTTSVDLSSTYLDWARRNLTLNGFSGDNHTFERDDALGFVTRHPRGERYDLAVVDVPTFSNSKKTADFWDVQRHHVELLNRVLELLSTGGALFFSTSFRRFKLDAPALHSTSVEEITNRTVPPDFRNRRVHRCWRIAR